MTNIELVISQGYQVLSFEDMKKKLNELGYDITKQYVKLWRCSNVWNGVETVVSTDFIIKAE